MHIWTHCRFMNKHQQLRINGKEGGGVLYNAHSLCKVNLKHKESGSVIPAYCIPSILKPNKSNLHNLPFTQK